jgi:dTDP-4-amino-4,6-dideoxygalactose transaminase
MDAITQVAEGQGLWVIEDAAQAQGSRYKGRRVGLDGVVATYSFYAGKNLGACGEAGAITTNDHALAERLCRLREHGQLRKYYHQEEGFNARLDAWQAAVLRIKLPLLDEWNAQRRRAAAQYLELLRDLEELQLPCEPDWAEGNYHLFVIHTDRRDGLQQYLTDNGIRTGLHYPLPLHLQEAYRHLGLTKGSFPVAERLAEQLLSFPMYPGLTEDDVEYVAGQVRAFFRS